MLAEPMNTLLALLPWTDWLALFVYVGLWVGYAVFAKRLGQRDSSLLVMTNRYRLRWMEEASSRDPRMLDGLIAQSLAQTPAFFSSTSILIIGALFALLGTADNAAELMNEIPFAQTTSVVVFDFKVLLLIGIFVYAFFRFSWCMRQYTFVSLLVGAMPSPQAFQDAPQTRQRYVQRAAAMVGSAAETFNDGLRAYYFSFAAIAWFFSAWAMLMATWVVVLILYRREFRSEALEILRD
jgi:uncharacterized membrane protein